MSKIVLIDPVDELHGKVSKHDDTIFRMKYFRDAEGRFIAKGAQEAYHIHNPRDFTKTPAIGAEKQRLNNWATACRQAAIECRPDHSRYAYWRQRWSDQLHRPDSACPPDRKTHQPKSYLKFDCFVRAAIYWQLSAK